MSSKEIIFVLVVIAGFLLLWSTYALVSIAIWSVKRPKATRPKRNDLAIGIVVFFVSILAIAFLKDFL